MRIIILGTGAMACLYGARLATIADVTLMGTWPEGITALRQRGVVVEAGGKAVAIRAKAAQLDEAVEPADLVLVLVKSWQTERVALRLPALLKPEGAALTLQNGLGNWEKLNAAAEGRVYQGLTTHGATLLGPGRVRPGGSGVTRINGPDWLGEPFQQARFEVKLMDEIMVQGAVWGKLCVNCGINAITALLRITNGELLKRPDAMLMMDRASVECAMVAWSIGVLLPFGDPITEVRRVAQATANNYSSMYQDVARGAPTEIEAINGAVVRAAKQYGILASANEMLWRLVRAMVSHKEFGTI